MLAKSEFLGVIVIFCEICGCDSIEYCSIEFVGFSSLPTLTSFDWQGRGYAILGACSSTPPGGPQRRHRNSGKFVPYRSRTGGALLADTVYEYLMSLNIIVLRLT